MTTPANLAISGYDPVSYFTATAPLPGSPDHTAEYQRRLYYFATPENKALFESDPDRYAPQCGGFCVVGLYEGHDAPVNPHTYVIHEGRLYFFYNQDGATTRGDWDGSEAQIIQAASLAWQGMLAE